MLGGASCSQGACPDGSVAAPTFSSSAPRRPELSGQLVTGQEARGLAFGLELDVEDVCASRPPEATNTTAALLMSKSLLPFPYPSPYTQVLWGRQVWS